MCHVRQWNLSYQSLTSYEARARLRSLKQDNPEFWFELTQKRIQDVTLKESEPQAEDAEEVEFHGGDDGELDDSDIPLKMVIDSIVTGRKPKNVRARENGTFESIQAEHVEDVSDTAEMKAEDLGRGKRVRKANRLYAAFWKHNDNDESDKEDGS
jgi:hypothetical protein